MQNNSTESNAKPANSLGAKDNVGQAAESGEPRVSGRSHGEIIDDLGTGAGKNPEAQTGQPKGGHNDNTSGKSGNIDQATESGRQRAIP